MRTRTRLEGLMLPLVSCLLLASPVALAAPTVGEAAPEFRFDGPEGKTLRLADYVGKKGVVVAWFPKAFTPG